MVTGGCLSLFQEGGGLGGFQPGCYPFGTVDAFQVIRINVHPCSPPCDGLLLHLDFPHGVTDAGGIIERVGAERGRFCDPREGLADNDWIARVDQSQPGVRTGGLRRKGEDMPGGRGLHLGSLQGTLGLVTVSGSFQPFLRSFVVLGEFGAELAVMLGSLLLGGASEVMEIVVGERGEEQVAQLRRLFLLEELFAGLSRLSTAFPDLSPEAGVGFVVESLACTLPDPVALGVLESHG